MDLVQIKVAAQAGPLPPEVVQHLLDHIERQQRTIRRLEADLERLRQRLAQYEPEMVRETSASSDCDTPPPPPSHYSLDAEDQRRQPPPTKKTSPGRQPTACKFADADRYQDISPPQVAPEACELVRERAVWRLENGQALLVGYHIYRAPGGPEPRIPGVLPRGEYGLEVLVVVAFLVYVIGISLDKCCAVLTFFCNLPMSKSQADALLRQLAGHWEGEYDTLCDLIAHAAMVAMDETGWKGGQDKCSLWTFASELQRVFLFGCAKDAATWDTILPRDVFQGIGLSDDAAVYRHRFRRAQKCWAHLLRKAIKLSLLYPRKKTYQRFLERLLAIYHEAKKLAAAEGLTEAERRQRVLALEERLVVLCQPYYRETTPEMTPPQRTFTNLVNELMERQFDEELFTFVLHPEVAPTNNLVERLQRGPALERKAGRTSKTAAGAHRRSVIVSVLESLRANLKTFTLETVLTEVGRWLDEGISRFGRQWQALQEAATATATPEVNSS